MSPYCTNCGTEVEETWNICPSCGNILEKTDIPQNQTQVQVNPYQQAEQRFRNPYQRPEIQPYQKKYSSGMGYNYGIASLGCGIIGLIFGFFFMGPILGIPAIILGGLGIGKDQSSVLGAIGIILGIVDVMLGFFFWFVWIPWMWYPY